MDKPAWIDKAGPIIAAVVIGVYAFTVIAPYFIAATGDMLQLIDRSKGTVDTITVMVVSFFFGASYGQSKDKDTINTLVKENR